MPLFRLKNLPEKSLTFMVFFMVPAGSPAIDCRCMHHELLSTKVVLMTGRADHSESYLPWHPSVGH